MKWTFQQIVPQNARGAYKEALMHNFRWVAEEKYDGDRRVAQFCEGRVRITGRNVSKKDGLLVEKTDNVPHITKGTKQVANLDGTVLDGEMIVPEGFVCGAGGKSKHVTSIMGSLPAEAVRKQEERGWLRYVVFDCLYYKGTDVRTCSYEQRRRYAQDALTEWNNPHVLLAESTTKNKEAFLERILSEGGEGIILKDTTAIYGEPKKWVKVKKEINADVVIMGYEDAKEISTKSDGTVSVTKYHLQGWIGAIIFGQYKDGTLVEMGRTSGFDDETRMLLSEHKKKYLGKVIEIKANEREPEGAFRHPQFKQFRFDKEAKDCVYYPEET